MKTIRIRAVAFRDRDVWCAQCLERDIAVQAKSKDELVPELIRAIIDYVELDLEQGRSPLSKLPEAPKQFFKLFKQAETVAQVEPIVLPNVDAPSVIPEIRYFEKAGAD